MAESSYDSVYDGESALRHPLYLALLLCRDFRRSLPLGWTLFLRDLKIQRTRALFGGFWIFFPPLASALVFLCLTHAKVFSPHAPVGVPFPIFLLAGTVYWQLFVDLVTAPSRLIEEAKILIVKLSFPKEGLIIAAALTALVSFLIRFALLLGATLGLGYRPSITGLLLGAFGVLPLVAFGLCVSLCLLPWTLLFREFAQGTTISANLLLFVTPVGYYLADAKALPYYFLWNPLTYLVSFPRDVFFSLAPWTLGTAECLGLASLLALIVSWVFFRLSLPFIIERFGV